MNTTKLSSMISVSQMHENLSLIQEMGNELGIELDIHEQEKIKERAKKLVDIFSHDLIDFKQVIEEATFEDYNILDEFNSSKQIVLASADIKNKITLQTADFDAKMRSVNDREISRNLWDVVIRKTPQEKEREVLARFMDYLKRKRDEFERFSQDVTINIANLKSEKSVVMSNIRTLSKKAIMLNLSSAFFKTVLRSHIAEETPQSEYASKLTALDRRLRTIYEIIIVSKKNIIDINNQIDMYNEVQNVLNEYKISAIKILSSEIKNRIVLQDLKEIYSSLDDARKTVNSLLIENAKLSEKLTDDIHKLSKNSIFDKENIEDSINIAQSIRDTKIQRDKEIKKTIDEDNKSFAKKISQMNQKEKAWNELQNAKSLLEI